ncbi:MAG: 16S rRNA (guanine(966)-N(2))-methyltransferase RsmD [Pseudomonadales bacterium]
MASNAVRIIGGKWRGRKLAFPDEPQLRPTLGRVRETLFNWLRDDVPGSRCLDLFAGSGALGFEALSRGAAAVTFVDSSRSATRCLEDNLRTLGADNATVICSPAERVLRSAREPWDIIFLDPPFKGFHVADILQLIRDREALAAEGLIYIEAPRREELQLGSWTRLKHGQAGDTQFALLASP